MNNITDIEKVENLLKVGNYNKMFRINFNGYRLYLQEEPFAYYSGLTGALSAATFQGDQDAKRLNKWRNSMIDSFGQKNTEDFVQMTADFGTLLHMALVTIKEKGLINWNEEKDKAISYFIDAYKQKAIEPDFRTIKKIVYEYQKHVASLLQFVYERVHAIHAIETPAKWELLSIATPIDLFCSCRQTEKGGFTNTTINLKTSSQISKHQLDQVACEMAMWNETYDDKAVFTGIMRTKDWTEGKTPTFEYKYLDKDSALKLASQCEKRLKLCLESDSTYFPLPVNKSFEGITKVGEQPLITSKTLEQEWTEVNIKK
jgi:hypothetical protein